MHAGVEALAGYVHGDPDCPVLLGVAHDSRRPNPVTSAIRADSRLRSKQNATLN